MSKKEYTVCHACQQVGMINCSDALNCGCYSTYPIELRQMIEELHDAKLPISIIAEKAFDMGKGKFGEWVNLNDRIPDIGTRVIVIDDDGDQFIDVRMGNILGEDLDEKWYCYTHWMPLPEKPITDK